MNYEERDEKLRVLRKSTCDILIKNLFEQDSNNYDDAHSEVEKLLTNIKEQELKLLFCDLIFDSVMNDLGPILQDVAHSIKLNPKYSQGESKCPE